MDKNIYYGKNVQFLKRMKNVSREEMANQLGVSSMTLYNHENETTYPTIKVLHKASLYFRVGVDKLMYENLEEKKQNLMNPRRIDFKEFIYNLEEFIEDQAYNMRYLYVKGDIQRSIQSLEKIKANISVAISKMERQIKNNKD